MSRRQSYYIKWMEDGMENTLKTNFAKVREFMKAFGQEVKSKPDWPKEDTMELRIDLIEEELEELKDAIINGDGTLVDVADALSDLLYVVYGAGHSFGIDLNRCFAEVHRSNMSKLGDDGLPFYREDGKVLKGPNFSEPDLERVMYESDDEDETESKSWQQLFMEEQLGYYNEEHETTYTFEEYYDAVVNGKIEIHYDWKQLLGWPNMDGPDLAMTVVRMKG